MGRKIGYGHITRCLSISQALKEAGADVSFIINGDRQMIDILPEIPIDIIDWIRNKNKLLKRLQGVETLLIDSILIDQSFFKQISTIVSNMIFIDDYHRWNHSKGIIIDWTIGKDGKNISKKNNSVSYLFGAKYTALRKEFWLTKPKSHSKMLNNVLITFGGSDTYNMTPIIMNLIKTYYPTLKMNVIIGKGFSNVPEIISESNVNTKLIYYPNASKMKESMVASDIAIGAGGQTLYELASLGIPTIAIILVDNQIDDTKGWADKRFLFNVGWYHNKSLEKTIINFLKILKNYELRESMGNVGQLYIDGKGAKRIAEYTIKQLK